jgi:hypothetical protein
MTDRGNGGTLGGMKRYADKSGDSGISAYELQEDAIVVKFKHGGIYRYDAETPGRRHVAAMKMLAAAGEGLATYINQHVREDYSEKLAD